MKKVFIIGCLGIFIASGFSLQKKNSGGVVGTTGSPGEGTCNGCHGGGAAGTSIAITSVPAFTNNNYQPAQVYTITITVTHPSLPAFGFDFEVLNASNANAGTLSSAGSGMQFFTTGGRKNGTHTTPKTGLGGASWTFVWTAPTSGNATFYVSGNAVNQNNNTSGDFPTNTNLALTPDLSQGIKENVSEISEFRFFPNPAADICSFSYNLNSDSDVSVDLFGIDGKLVRNLLSEKQNAGSHNQIVDLKSVSKGIYFVRVSLNGEKQNQRLISVQ